MTTSNLAPDAAPRPVRLGMIGLGAATVPVIRVMARSPLVKLVAAADLRPQSLAAFREQFGGNTYERVADLCADPEVEAVWIATPNQFHCPHAVMAANAGKHVFVEKPMALSVEEAQQMVDAAERNGVQLMCGRTAATRPPMAALTQLVAGGELGKVRAVNAYAYTNWMFRPRMPQEVDLATGGGIVFRQLPHQVDVVRVLGGGMLRSVRAGTGQWFPTRNVPGYASAYLEFEDGTPSIIAYNGYGYFTAWDMLPWAGESPYEELGVRIRRQLRETGSSPEEGEAKEAARFGGAQPAQPAARAPRSSAFQGDVGILIVSCDLGDVRQSPEGLYVYDDNGRREITVSNEQADGATDLEEIYGALRLGRAPAHDGRWGLATLEVVMAVMESARERREVLLKHQCPVRA